MFPLMLQLLLWHFDEFATNGKSNSCNFVFRKLLVLDQWKRSIHLHFHIISIWLTCSLLIVAGCTSYEGVRFLYMLPSCITIIEINENTIHQSTHNPRVRKYLTWVWDSSTVWFRMILRKNASMFSSYPTIRWVHENSDAQINKFRLK